MKAVYYEKITKTLDYEKDFISGSKHRSDKLKEISKLNEFLLKSDLTDKKITDLLNKKNNYETLKKEIAEQFLYRIKITTIGILF